MQANGVVDAGPLGPLLSQPGVTDVLVNAPDSVWVDRGDGVERTPVRFADDAAVRRLASRLATAAGRRLDDASPFVDAVLADGTRLHAALPPVVARTTISMRVLPQRGADLDELCRRGTADHDVQSMLIAIVRARLSFVISGATGAGKTTLLGALLSVAAPTERIVIIEQVPELVVAHPHTVRLLTRSANIEGSGAIEQRELVRQALRMRPDRLVVGEFRGAEIVELLAALNTGHDGGAATVHANSAGEVPVRCEALGALAGIGADPMGRLLRGAVRVVLHLRRDGGRRRLAEIAVVDRSAGVLPAWRDGPGSVADGAGLLRRWIEQRGIEMPGWWP